VEYDRTAVMTDTRSRLFEVIRRYVVDRDELDEVGGFLVVDVVARQKLDSDGGGDDAGNAQRRRRAGGR